MKQILPICDKCGPTGLPLFEQPGFLFYCSACVREQNEREQWADDLERDKAKRDSLEQARVMGLARVECEEVYLEQFNTVLEWIFKR